MLSGIPSLYLHFPFCETKCPYCDFYSIAKARARTEDPLRFGDAIAREAQLQGARLSAELDTLFMGGGTPSMTPAETMARVIENLSPFTKIGPHTEWTMEANPSSVSEKSLKEYRALGVNRLSMGVQALREDHLKLLGRVHSGQQALDAIDAAVAAGFINFSVDLLCGVPGQSLEDLDDAITTLTATPITHLSCYLLTLPPHHAMASQLPNEEIQLQHLLFIHDRLTERGFEHYEISNFARTPHTRARHNLHTWKGGSYLGLGPSAHSFDGLSIKPSRWKNVSSLHRYASMLEQNSPPVEWSESLTPEQQNLEKWMLALRLNDGFPRDWLQTPKQIANATLFEEKGLLEVHPQTPGFLRLTARGFALSESVIQSFV